MDFATLLRFALALALVLLLIVALGWVLRRYGPGAATPRSNGRRIGVLESAPLDAKRRLVLVRRDQVEHLLLLSPTHETVIETGISAANSGAAEAGAPQP